MEDQVKTSIAGGPKSKTINFCSPEFKKQKRENEHKNKKGYVKLMNKIKESTLKVSHIKTGKSLWENGNMTKEQHIPVLEDDKLRTSLVDLLDKSQNEMSIKPNKRNKNLIECLSPPKIPKRERKASFSRSLLDTQNTLITEGQQTMTLPLIQKNQSLRQTLNFTKSLNTTTIVNPQELKLLKKSFDFPVNPAYLNRSIQKRGKLKYLTDYCKEKHIALANNEKLVMNLDFSKAQFKLWRQNVNKIFDTQKNYKDESEELVDCIRNFDHLGLSRNDLTTLMKQSMSILNDKEKSLTSSMDDYQFLNTAKKLHAQRQRQLNTLTDISATQVSNPSKSLDAMTRQLLGNIKPIRTKKNPLDDFS